MPIQKYGSHLAALKVVLGTTSAGHFPVPLKSLQVRCMDHFPVPLKSLQVRCVGYETVSLSLSLCLWLPLSLSVPLVTTR